MSDSTPQPLVTRDDLRVVARFALGLLGTLGFLAVGFLAFGHKCTAGNKTFESVVPWVLAVLALACVLAFRRVRLALLVLVLLFIAVNFVSAWYLDRVHHGQPEIEHENAA